jgi:hypothetical protein
MLWLKWPTVLGKNTTKTFRTPVQSAGAKEDSSQVISLELDMVEAVWPDIGGKCDLGI